MSNNTNEIRNSEITKENSTHKMEEMNEDKQPEVKKMK